MSDYFGHVIIDTSSRNDDSIADDFVNSNPYGDKVYVINTNQWKVREHLNYYGRAGWFKVYCGDSLHQPFIIRDTRQLTPEMDSDRVIEVPEELRSDFEFNLITALQDKAGISTNSSDRFFPDTTNLEKCFTLPMHSPDVLKLDFFDRSDKLIYHLDRYLRDIPTDRILYIHYDIGVTGDNCGLSIAYFEKWKFFNNSEGGVRQPLIKVPVAVAINRYEDQETPIYQLEEFLLDLNKTYEIGFFSADTFASRQLMQDLTREGINNKYISVDRTDEPYVFLKSLVNNNLLELPNNKLLKTELAELKRIGNKIDHPSDGSKDVADSVTGAVFSCYQDIDKAGQLSNKYKVETYSKLMSERTVTNMDAFQNMMQGIY